MSTGKDWSGRRVTRGRWGADARGGGAIGKGERRSSRDPVASVSACD